MTQKEFEKNTTQTHHHEEGGREGGRELMTNSFSLSHLSFALLCTLVVKSSQSAP
jgi:hypothetical protein